MSLLWPYLIPPWRSPSSTYHNGSHTNDKTVSTVQSLLNVRPCTAPSRQDSYSQNVRRANEEAQVDPKLSVRTDDDGRLPIHWAASANQLDIVQLLAEQKGFDVDAKVRFHALSRGFRVSCLSAMVLR